MATYQIAPPEKFNFSQPEEWPKWSRRFERFRQASGLTAKEETSQINTLIYAMGDEADDILTSLKLTEAQKKKYDVVLQKFEGYFVKRRNPIFERAKFNSRKQEEGEPVDSFITALHCLAEHCGYGELHDEMIRDRLVVGLGDASLSERLQMDPDLTLEKAVTAARQSEAVKRQQAVVRGAEGQASNVDNVHTRPQQPKRHREGVQQQYRHVSAQQRHKQVFSSKTCTRCGKSPPHSRQQCPALEATCRKCGKKGHYQAVCRSTKSVNLVTTEQDEVFIAAVNGQVPTVDAGDNPWMVTVSVNGSPVDFKIDTGADVSVISDTTYKALTRKASLRPPRKSLTGPSCQPLEVCGQFTGTLQHGDCTACEEIFVVKSLQMSLLGRPAIESLGLVSRVHTVEDLKLRYTSKYPDLFKGLGKIPGEYHIHLKDDAKPFALSTPRRVALPLQPKVKKELQRMEQLGVISRVDDPTDWCAGMVVVPKSDGKVRICVDLTKLNESVRRERHILPSVDHSLAQLGGVKVFTKLDANSGFWQIELSKESALLTTFITPFGRFCFNRLPFGITSAPEHFQKRMSEILAGLEGVVCMVDDVLVHGRTQEEHDQRLDAAMECIAQAGVSLNAEKCDFSQSSVKFLGHIIDGTGIHPDPEKVQAIQAMKEPNNTTELRRFLGMTNQLAKFTPSLAEQAKPFVICSARRTRDDPPLALLAYRSTPLKNGYSPAELLMCRKLRTTVPVVPEQLQPKMPDYDSLARREREMRMQQKCTFDQRHKARRLDPLVPGDLVWIPQNQTEGTVLTEVAPRSYQVTTPSGVLRRNRHQLRLLPSPHNCTREEDTTHQPDDLDSGPQHPPADGQYRTRSGRVSVPPDRYEPTM